MRKEQEELSEKSRDKATELDLQASIVKDLKKKVEQLESHKSVSLLANDNKNIMIPMREVSEEFVCGSCSMLPIKPRALECGHIQCEQCTRERLQQNTLGCFICNSGTDIGIHLLSVENLTRKIIHYSSIEEKKKWESREKKLLSKENDEKQYQNLLNAVKEAKKSGKTFTSCLVPWDKKIKTKFVHGVSVFSGKARKFYCEVVGLTNENIDTWDSKQLKQVILNIDLQIEPFVSFFFLTFKFHSSCTKRDSKDSHVRNKLKQFIDS